MDLQAEESNTNSEEKASMGRDKPSFKAKILFRVVHSGQKPVDMRFLTLGAD